MPSSPPPVNTVDTKSVHVAGAATKSATGKPKANWLGHVILSGTVFGGAAAVLWSVDEANPNGYYGDIKTWTFEPREGLHSLIVPAVAISLYLAMVAFLPMVMKNREPLNLKWLMLIHNYILSTGSLVATIAMVRLVIPVFLKGDIATVLTNAVCDPGHAFPRSTIFFWYFVFYLSKMYEFIDTLILILRKKPLIFLHVYHHIITLALCWVMLDDKMSIQWLCTIANTAIHSFMYYFYACQSVNLDVWWKKHLTKGQIVQFIVGNVGNISWSYYKQYQGLDCDGSWFGFWMGVGVIASFLGLFVQFYARSYKRPVSKRE